MGRNLLTIGGPGGSTSMFTAPRVLVIERDVNAKVICRFFQIPRRPARRPG